MKKKSNSVSKHLSPTLSRSRTWSRVPKVFGVGLFISAFLIGLGAVNNPIESQEFFVFTNSLPVGSKITATDFRKVTLPSHPQLQQFESFEEELIGAELARPVNAGEFAASGSLKSTVSTLQELTIGFDPISLPPQIQEGDVLDLWVVPTDNAGNILGPAQLIAANLAVAAAGQDSNSISTQLPITFFTYPNQVAEILNAVVTSKSFVVRK